MATVTTQLTGVEAEVLRADDGRFEAMRKGDWTGLDAALADDLIYVHSTARQESKAEHIANLRAGKPNYRGIAPRDRRVRSHRGRGDLNGVSDRAQQPGAHEHRSTLPGLPGAAQARPAAQR